MGGLTRRTSAGGLQWIIPSVLSLPILAVGFAALGAGPLGIIIWPAWAWILKKAVQEEAEKRFPPDLSDSVAHEALRGGKNKVDVTHTSWSDAPIPLPRHLTTRYTVEDDDDS